MESVPLRSVSNEDSLIFGKFAVILGGLARMGFPIAPGIVVTPPRLNLQTILQHYDLENKEVFEQSLTLVKKDLAQIPIPDEFEREIREHKQFLVGQEVIKSKKELWLHLLDLWIS